MKPRAMKPRGLTFVTVLIVLAISAGFLWLFTYGQAYWENMEVKAVLNQAANLSYSEHDDAKVRQFIEHKLHEMFDVDVEERGRMTKEILIDYTAEDLRIERSKVPAWVHIWLTYTRNVRVPLTGGVKPVTFVDHAEQDLAPVKW